MTKLKKSKGQAARQIKAKRAAFQREKREFNKKKNEVKIKINARHQEETSSEIQYSSEDQSREFDAENQEEEDENSIQLEDDSIQDNDDVDSQEQDQEQYENYDDSSNKEEDIGEPESGDEEEEENDEDEEGEQEEEAEEDDQEQNTEESEESIEDNSQISGEDNEEDQDAQSNEDENDADEREDNGRKKIHRRRADEIEKEFKCRVKKCGRYYGSYPALYTHLKTKHSELGGDKLYKIANRERRRLIKLEADRLNQVNEDPEQINEEQEENSETEPIQKEEPRKKIKGNSTQEEADKKKIKGSQKVKEFYVEEYMHLIKPSLVNENQIKKFMKDKRQQEEQYGFNQQIDAKEKSGRRMFGTVEQIIQKSINKQLALAEIKKQQRNLKMQKIDKDKMSELTVFQPAYLFDLVQQIDLSWSATLKQEKQILKTVSFPETLLLSIDEMNPDEKSLKKKKQKKRDVLEKDDWLSDYPEINDQNQFLLEPLHKQLQYLRSVNRELGVEEIQGIGLRLAFALKHLHGFVCKPFYIEMVYIAGYLLRVLSIKKITLYQEISQDFLSIYEYVMNSVRYGGFADQIPIFAAFADLNRINSFARDTLLALLKIVFKSSNAYSENLLKQFYHYNQTCSSF